MQNLQESLMLLQAFVLKKWLFWVTNHTTRFVQVLNNLSLTYAEPLLLYGSDQFQPQ